MLDAPSVELLGWDDRWQSELERLDDDNLIPARIAAQHRGEYVAWSPNGHWLLLNWTSADQWLFIRSATVRKVDAVSHITASFGPHARIAGWCCR